MGTYTNACIAYGLEVPEEWLYENRIAEGEEGEGECPLSEYSGHPWGKRLEELGLRLDWIGDLTGYDCDTGRIIIIPETKVSVSSSTAYCDRFDMEKILEERALATSDVTRDGRSKQTHEFLSSIGLDWNESDWFIYWSRG